MNGEAGKGSTPRPVDRKKWDRAWLRAFGVPCPDCKTKGVVGIPDFEGTTEVCTVSYCPRCQGMGYIERKKDG
jgi:DnaJ-class molecular chaperone